MTGWRQRSQSRTGHATRVAVAVAFLIAVLYVAVVGLVRRASTPGTSSAEVDGLVKDRLEMIAHGGGSSLLAPAIVLPVDNDVDDAPVVVWLAPRHARAFGLTPGRQRCPPAPGLARASATTATLGAGPFAC